MALGPLTNLALAVKLDQHFPLKLRDLYIMGGNMEGKTAVWCLSLRCLGVNSGDFGFTGKGNAIVCAEFNFAMDPESAYIVLEEFHCPTYLASWEYACRNALSWVRHARLEDCSTLQCISLQTKIPDLSRSSLRSSSTRTLQLHAS